MFKTKRIFAVVMSLLLMVSLVPAVNLSVGALEENGFLYEISGGTATVRSWRGTGTFVRIPAATDSGIPVVAIGDQAFINNNHITGVYLPPTVTRIGYAAFGAAWSLTTINLSNVTDFGADPIDPVVSATFGATALRRVSFSQDGVNIPGRAFARTPELRHVNFSGSGNVNIGREAFSESKMSSLEFTRNVTSINDLAFEQCDNLRTVRFYANTPPTFGNKIFGDSPVEEILVPAGTKERYSAAFTSSGYNGDFTSKIVEIVSGKRYGDAVNRNINTEHLNAYILDLSHAVRSDSGWNDEWYFKSYAFLPRARASSFAGWKDIKATELSPGHTWDTSRIIKGAGRLVLSTNSAATNRQSFLTADTWQNLEPTDTAGFMEFNFEQVATAPAKMNVNQHITYSTEEAVAFVDIGVNSEYRLRNTDKWLAPREGFNDDTRKWARVPLHDRRQPVFVRTKAAENTNDEDGIALPSLPLTLQVPAMGKAPRIRINPAIGTMQGTAGWVVEGTQKHKVSINNISVVIDEEFRFTIGSDRIVPLDEEVTVLVRSVELTNNRWEEATRRIAPGAEFRVYVAASNAARKRPPSLRSQLIKYSVANELDPYNNFSLARGVVTVNSVDEVTTNAVLYDFGIEAEFNGKWRRVTQLKTSDIGTSGIKVRRAGGIVRESAISGEIRFILPSGTRTLFLTTGENNRTRRVDLR
ncbi:MAG: leucine-rich repeat domain-containing protein [Oscillospiraceae bacterium]|nr:leucine-rich repeat domain-containing protein [Oscillospiraceae bacterium]